MSWGYQYTPDIWPMLASAAFAWSLAAYVWRHRTSPGALAFAISCTLVGAWTVGIVFEMSVTNRDLAFWFFRCQMILTTPSAVAGLWFILDYAGLDRWLNRTTRALLIWPSILIVPAYVLDGARLLWDHVGYVDGRSVRVLSPLGTVWNLYGLAILALTVAVLIYLFVRSPLYRKAAALMMLGHSAVVSVQVLEMLLPAPVLRPSLMILSVNFAFAMYAVAFFRYRLLDVVPVARDSVIERMPDAMVVLDSRNRIADLNLAAQRLLGMRRQEALGREAARALASFTGIEALIDSHTHAEREVSLRESGARRWYRGTISPLEDGRGFRLGSLIVLRDTTELRLAQRELIRKEHAAAALQERERMARDLHDAIGQVLGYVSIQVEATRKLLEDGKPAEAYIQLARLANVARDAHADLRGYILDLRTAPSVQRPFVATLDRYLADFGQNYGLQIEFSVAPEIDEGLGQQAQSQLFRIVQEALTNARRHGGASLVQVSIEAVDGQARVVIQDDGSGFDSKRLGRDDGHGYGLQFMRERAVGIGGRVEVASAPGSGTRIVVEVPLGRSQVAGGEHASTVG